jgi:uncharacterized repeat protein (TIGR02059 family)
MGKKLIIIIALILIIPVVQCLVWTTPVYAEDLQAPTAPQNIWHIKIGSIALFFWGAAADNEEVAGYEIYRNGEKVATTTKTFSLLSGFSSQTGYAVYIKAYDAAGNLSAPSKTVIINKQYYQDIEAPTAPLNLRSTETTGTSITLAWDAATDNVGVTGYEVYQNNILLEKVTGTTYKVAGLKPLTTYRFSVKAFDAAGNGSEASNLFEAATIAKDIEAPTTPENFRYFKLGSLVVFNWDAAKDNEGVAGYEIYRNGEKIATTTKTSYLMSGLSSRVTYAVYIKAYDADGNLSAPSKTLIINKEYNKDTEAPTAPCNLRSTETTGTSITLAWDAATDNVGVTGYEVYQNNILLEKVTGTTYTVTGLETGREYRFIVKAYDAAGKVSDGSNEIIVTPIVEAPALLNAATTTDGTKILLEFNKEMAVPPAAPAGFTVVVNGVTNPVQAVNLSSNKTILELTLAQIIYQNEIAIEVAYTAGTVTSADGGELADFRTQQVVNKSTVNIALTENRYFYDDLNRLLYIQLSTGEKVYYEYDENGNLLGTKTVN